MKQVWILLAILGVCWCHSEYKVINAVQNATFISLELQYFGSDEYYIKPSSPIIKKLLFTFKMLSYNEFSFKITDINQTRFQIPHGSVFPQDPIGNSSFPISLSQINFRYKSMPFDFSITRKVSPSGTLFDTFQSDNFIFSQYYMQITTKLDTGLIYGIGQRFSANFRKTQGKWTIFNRDRGCNIDEGEGLQSYGYYPFYLLREENKLFHVNYLRSSNAMDVVIQNNSSDKKVTFKIIGGVFDFRFILGNQNPETTIMKLHNYIGRSAIPPFWSLGFHQCRWGYKNVSDLQNVIASYDKYLLPLDTIWSDIDYMIDFEDFTIDESKFPLDQMKQILERFHYIPIIDAGIKINDGIAYTEGKKRNVFIKDGSGQQLHGKVWPGPTTFVDFFNPNSTEYWNEMLDILYQKIPFSGVWLDMNEYANFCDGPCEQPTSPSIFDYSKDLPYNPGNDSIESHTIPLNSTHYQNGIQANLHSFGAMLQSYATNVFLNSKKQRPFIITRSSTFGSNRYAFHWTGDNYASWQFLKSSISDNFNSQLWGIQMVGPDICGFAGNTTEQLCARWYQLAAAYPFARSHNVLDAVPQEPYALGEKVLLSAQTNLGLRYSMLKQYYSIFLLKKGKGTIFRPLFFEFPQDHNLYFDPICDTQFMIGDRIMVAPIVEQNTTSRKVYFPYSVWYNLHNGDRYLPGTQVISNILITGKLPIFIRQDSIIMMQNSTNVRNTSQLDSTYQMYIGFRLDSKLSNQTHQYYRALGQFSSIQNYNDNTKVDSCIQNDCSYSINLSLLSTSNVRTMNIKVSYSGAAGQAQTLLLNQVNIYYEDAYIINDFVEPIEINQKTDITIPINDPTKLKVLEQ